MAGSSYGARISELAQADPERVALRGHLAQQLVHYKVPRSVEFIDGPLRDDAGKVRRSALRAARIDNT